MKPAAYQRRLEAAIRTIASAHQRQREARHRGIFDARPAQDLTNAISEATRLIKEHHGPNKPTGPPASTKTRHQYR